MGHQNAATQIIRENFTRLKFVSLVFAGYAVFTLATDYLPLGVWNQEVIGIYRALDWCFVALTILAAIVSWGYKGGNDAFKRSGVEVTLFLSLVWSALVTSVEFTSIGFTALTLMALVVTLFFRFNLATTAIYFAGMITGLLAGLHVFGKTDGTTVTMLFMVIPFTGVMLILSRKNYLSRINELKAAGQLAELNEELTAAKEHLEDEVVRRTAELLAAKDKAEESDRLKSAFLANISHEVRTPMNGILGFAELLKEPGLTGAEQAEYIANIERSSERMLNTINDIVDIARIDSGVVQPASGEADVPAILARTRDLFLPVARDKGLRLRLTNALPGGGGSVLTDADMLFSCLSHLVKNSIKFTPRGEVEFGCRLGPTPDAADVQPPLLFFVRDTGIGVPKERQAAIFERFVQADITDSRAFQGVGLGLSIAKAYVAMLGGKLWLESEPGSGSTFFFTIPWKPGRTAWPDPVGGAEALTSRHLMDLGLKILVVEDDAGSALFLKTALRDISGKILCATNGAAAVQGCVDNPDVDVVLMDIKMPVMSGYEATARIREINRDVVIIAQTAFALAGDREKALEAGADDYLSKPLSRAKLIACIAANLAKRGRMPAAKTISP